MARQAFITDEVRRNIKQIEICTRRLLRGMLVGDSRSAMKGTGFEFDQIRDYQVGDDVRFIDWNASARMDSLLVKQYIEERSRLILLALDVSGSTEFGSSDVLKRTTMAQIASVLTLVADAGKDYVGLILFSDDVEYYIPPGRGRFHTQTIMEYAFGFKAQKTTTDISAVFKKLAQLKRKDAMVFLISDFIDDIGKTSYASLVSRLYDVVAVRCLDEREQELPAVGFIPVEDCETGEMVLLDARKGKRASINHFLQERLVAQDTFFSRYNIDVIDVTNRATFVGDLVRFFRQRMRY